MNMHAELLQFYRSKTLAELLDRTSSVFASIGFPHLVLKWSPAAASSQKMMQNSSMIWTNFDERFGRASDEVVRALQGSISIGIERALENTLELHRWRQSQDGSYQLAGDAPKPFFLTQYQRSIIKEFGEAPWSEIIVLRLARERERILVLEAKTQAQLTHGMIKDAHAVLSVFACVYQCLHRPIAGTHPEAGQGPPLADLSKREIQCLQWLAAGKTYSEAAIILDVSERTLRFHVGNARVSAALEYGFNPKDPRRSMYQASRAPVISGLRKVV